MRRMRHILRRDDTGASAVEYALVLVAICALIVLSVFALGGKTSGMFEHTCDTVDAQPTTTCQ